MELIEIMNDDGMKCLTANKALDNEMFEWKVWLAINKIN